MNSLALFKDLITTGNMDAFANFSDYDYNRFIDDVMQSGIMQGKLTSAEAANLSKLLNAFPIDNLLPFWKRVATMNTYNTVALHPYVSMRLVEALSSMNQQKSA